MENGDLLLLSDQAAQQQFRLEDEFYQQSDLLRKEFEQNIVRASEGSAGLTSLEYVFLEHRYCFLMGDADEAIAPETLNNWIQFVCAWGREHLGTEHASTPQLHVYVKNCRRALLRDDLIVGWHYALSLTRTIRSNNSRLRLLIPNKAGRLSFLKTCSLLNVNLDFNRFVVHDTQLAYGVEAYKTEANPLEATILLDGYLW
jgi:hypothetical protein